jgi:hypothetical protein
MWHDEAARIPKTQREIAIAIDNAVINRDDIQQSHPCAKGFYYVMVQPPNPHGRTDVERNGVPFTITMNTASEVGCTLRLKFTTGGWTKNAHTGMWTPENVKWMK